MDKCVSDVIFQLYNPFSQLDTVKEILKSLLERCPHSYYHTWGWNALWLKDLPSDCGLILVVGYLKELPVIAFFLGSIANTRHKFFKYQQLALNQTLIRHIDEAKYIEYNSILIDPQIKFSLVSLLDQLPIKSWDEFRMIRCSSFYQPNLIFNKNLNKKYSISSTKYKSYYVDLDKIRFNNNDYFGLLSHKKRNQIRHSIREYEKMGKIRVCIAKNINESLEIFDELVELHQKRWTDLGHTGALSNEFIIDSIKSVITTRFEYGEIQMIKISSGDHTIGCLYQIVYNGKVLCTNSGFNYLPGKAYRPGLVCHYYAINYSASIDLQTYDFMFGEQEYKQSLSTDYYELFDITVQKNSLKACVEKMAVKLHRLLMNNVS